MYQEDCGLNKQGKNIITAMVCVIFSIVVCITIWVESPSPPVEESKTIWVITTLSGEYHESEVAPDIWNASPWVFLNNLEGETILIPPTSTITIQELERK